jgi:hypothetical protein
VIREDEQDRECETGYKCPDVAGSLTHRHERIRNLNQWTLLRDQSYVAEQTDSALYMWNRRDW